MKKDTIMHIKKTIILLITFMIPSNTLHLRSHFISYQLTPGSRLGDHLLTYSLASAVADIAKLPLHGPSFKYADKLTLSTDNLYIASKKKRTVILSSYQGQNLAVSPGAPIAYVCTLKTTINNMRGFNDFYNYTKTHPLFKAHLVHMISPLYQIEQLPLPSDMITVAVHVRTGGGFDKPLFMNSNLKKKPASTHYFADQMYPERFPPESFYIEQIAQIAKLCKNKPLFIHIFTDDKNPPAIVARFKAQLLHINGIFSCRTGENSHDTNVLDDLFNMMKFDCLIRPASSYSKMAQLLGNHTIIIYPKKVKWIKDTLTTEKVGIINHSLWHAR